MNVALIEPFAGIAGDMFVGALLHAGAPLEGVRDGLEGLGLSGWSVSSKRVMRCGMSATQFAVAHEQDHHHRGLTAILEILKKADLPARTRERAAAAFTVLGEAEAKIHGTSVDQVHFHEVGALDAICDIVGAALALEALDVERLWCRPLPLSTGTIVAAHGRLPVPAPASLELMRGRPVYDSGLVGELVTPTGAAMVRAWAEQGAPLPFVPRAIGYGAGDRDPEGYANVCRVTLGELTGSQAGQTPGALSELVCDLDDATPQVLGHLLGRLLEAGALDATLQPVQMKKNRPGTRVTALTPAQAIPAVERVLFTEGTTLGVRRRAVERTELARRVVEVQTRHGTVRVKLGELGGELVHVQPEYDDCRALAQKTGVPLREIIRLALREWRE